MDVRQGLQEEFVQLTRECAAEADPVALNLFSKAAQRVAREAAFGGIRVAEGASGARDGVFGVAAGDVIQDHLNDPFSS